MRLVARLLRALRCAAVLPALVAAPAFAQFFTLLQPPDLSVALTGTPATADAAVIVTYTLTVTNHATYRNVCRRDPLTLRYVCGPEPTSSDAGGVVLQVNWGGGAQFFGASGDSGFGCVGSATQLTCANGTIPAGASGHVTLQLRMPNAAASVALSAAVDPFGAISERDETNNGATLTTTVLAPTGNRPDLNCSVTGPDTFDGRSGVDYNLFLRNMGPVAAGNVTIQLFAPLSTRLLSLTPSNGFSCYFLSGANQPLLLQCVGGSIPAWGSAFMSIRVSPGTQLPSGTPMTMSVTMDPQNVIPELFENNNQCNKAAITVP